jgi:hypothetical protein
LGAGIDDRALVDRITFTFKQKPSRQVTVQPGILSITAGFGWSSLRGSGCWVWRAFASGRRLTERVMFEK